jgi:hypothetical protein
MKTITYPVKDLAAAKQLYAKLFGVEPYMDEAYCTPGGAVIGATHRGRAATRRPNRGSPVRP